MSLDGVAAVGWRLDIFPVPLISFFFFTRPTLELAPSSLSRLLGSIYRSPVTVDPRPTAQAADQKVQGGGGGGVEGTDSLKVAIHCQTSTKVTPIIILQSISFDKI